MSAAGQTIGAVGAAKKPKKIRPAAELRRLIPYLGPYKGATFFGLLTLLIMGLVGAFPPLLIGGITDCLKNAPEPLPNLTAAQPGASAMWHTVLQPILRFYEPGSRHTLGLLCLMLVAVVIVKGIFSFASRQI